MGERVRCSNCTCELRTSCDEMYDTFIFTQGGIRKMVEDIPEELSMPVVLRTEKQLDAMSEFTALNRPVAIGYVQSIGCLLTEQEIDENLTKEIITRG